MTDDPELMCYELPDPWEAVEISEEPSLEDGFTFISLVSDEGVFPEDQCPTQIATAGLPAGKSFAPRVDKGPAIITVNGGRLTLSVCGNEPVVVQVGGGEYLAIEVDQVFTLGPNDAVFIDPNKRLVLHAPSELETLVSGYAVDLSWVSRPQTLMGCLGIKCIGKG